MHQAPPQTETLAFSTTILLSGKTTTGDDGPPDIAASLDAGRRPPVRAGVNGHAYRTDIAPVGKQRFVVSSEGARTGETRQRRISRVGAQPGEGRR